MTKYFDLMNHTFVNPTTGRKCVMNVRPSVKFPGFFAITIPDVRICKYVGMEMDAFYNFLECNGIYSKLVNPANCICVKLEDFPVLESVINRKLNSIYASDSEKLVSISKIHIEYE